MALQGTIDSFPIVDVMQLLSTSKKTGRLELVGDRGRGTLWFDAGDLVAGAAQGRACGDPAQALWELLRFSDGSFEFHDGEVPTTVGFEPTSTELTIGRATQMLGEWTQIEQRVPSLYHTVVLAEHLPGGEVRLTAEDWALVVGAGPSPSVGALIDAVGHEEFEGCRRIAEMVDRGLLAVLSAGMSTSRARAEPSAAAVPVGFGGQAHHVPEELAVAEHTSARMPAEEPTQAAVAPSQPVREAPERASHGHAMAHGTGGDTTDSSPFPEHFPIDDLVGETTQRWDDVDTAGLSAARHGHPGTTTVVEATSEVVEPQAAVDGDDVLAQIGRLSPKAAEAIAAALGEEEDRGRAG